MIFSREWNLRGFLCAGRNLHEVDTMAKSTIFFVARVFIGYNPIE